MMPPPASSASAPNPPLIPGWKLLRAIGRGSYGEVWLAQETDGTYRAVKVVYRSTFDNDRPYQRELSGIRRFEPISRGHPSQVSIYSVGENPADNLFYYVMELADDANADPIAGHSPASLPASVGESPPAPLNAATYQPKTLKSESSRRGRLPYRECIEIGVALATALEHLHQHGLIHRDIKPSNVIFVGGVPKLADIGLVTGLDASISFVGTEGFLPPEGPGTAQGDIYSLGKVLYEISTGQDRMDFPELPTVLGDGAEKEQLLELNQILLKACQNDIRHRYRTARELLADLWLLHEGRSIRKARAAEARLRQARAAMIAVGIIASLLIGGNYLLQQSRIRRLEMENAREAASRLREEERASNQTRRLASVYAAIGESLWTNGDWFGATVLFERALAETSVQPRGNPAPHLHRIQSILALTPDLAVVIAGTNRLTSARYSAQGARLITVDEAGLARVWTAASGRNVSTLRTTRPTKSAELSADGERAVLVDQDGAVFLASVDSPATLVSPLLPGGITGPTAFSPTGRQLAVARGETNLVLFEASSRRERFSFGHRQAIASLAFSPDNQFLASGSADGAIRIWSTDTGEPVMSSAPADGPVYKIAFSPNSRRLLSLTPAGARVHDARSGEIAPHPLRHDGRTWDADFAPDSRIVMTGGSDQMARIWDSVTGRLLGSLPHDDEVRRVAFSPDRRFLFTATSSSGHLWRDSTFAKQPPTFSHGGNLLASAFSPSGRHVLILTGDGAVRIFDLDRRFRTAGIMETPAAVAPLTQLLSGRRRGDDEKFQVLEPATILEHWEKFSAGRPSASASGPDPTILPWHRETARAAESNQLWFAAMFHWEQILRSDSRDREARTQLELARSNLARLEEAATRPADRIAAIPARATNTSERLLDLTRQFNATLTEAWLPGASHSLNNLASLPGGLQTFNGIEFDIRGMVQLSSRTMEIQGGDFPRRVIAIPVHRSCHRLHFLHGAVWSSLAGTTVGSYVVHYEDGQTNEIKIIFGRDIREWWSLPTQQAMTTGAAVAWEGSNPAAAALGLRLRLFQMPWTNPRPGAGISHIDFESRMESAAPFLLAITLEP